MFAVDTRKSRDGPIPSRLLPLLRRSPKIFVLGSFEVQKGRLPLSSDGPVPQFGDDDQAGLVGEVILFTRSQDKTIDNRLSEIRRHIRQIQDPYRDADTVAADIVSSRQEFEQLWEEMRSWFFADVKTSPAFARVSMTLSRTGAAIIDVDRNNIFFTEDVRERHWLSAHNKVRATDPEPEWQAAAQFIAHQSFFFLRDLSHRHYHHKPHSDMGTVVFPWAPTEDEEWRRETHYGLVRLAIKSRREDDPVTYKQSLGVIAYAESFQRHLAGWTSEPGVEAASRLSFYPYDFTSLKASIEASLRVLDFRNAQQVQHFAYLTLTALTTIGIILAAGQVMRVEDRLASSSNPLPILSAGFWAFVSWLVEHPIEVIAIVGVGTTLLVFRSQVVRQVDGATRLIGGLTRANDALLGTWVAQFANAAAAWVAASLFGFVILVVLVGWIGLILFLFIRVIESGVDLSSAWEWLLARWRNLVD